MKNKFFFLAIAMVLISIFFYGNLNAQKTICTVPKCDEDIIVEYVKEKMQIKSLYIAPSPIPFQLGAVGESVIGSDYIPGFKYRNSEGGNKNIIDKVKDSLSTRSDYLNAQMEKCDRSFSLLSKENRDNFVLFLSAKYDNTIYCEIIERNAIRYSGGKYEFSGSASSFVFMLPANGQMKVYEGKINYQ